jgi:hypothetical protein
MKKLFGTSELGPLALRVALQFRNIFQFNLIWNSPPLQQRFLFSPPAEAVAASKRAARQRSQMLPFWLLKR